MRSFFQTWTDGLVAVVVLALSMAAVGSLVLFGMAALAGMDEAPLWTAYAAPLWAPVAAAIALKGLRNARA
jgi:hypothetical protein